MEMYDDVNDMWEYFYGLFFMDVWIPLKVVRYNTLSGQLLGWT